MENDNGRGSGPSVEPAPPPVLEPGQRVGEVTEASTRELHAQSCRLHEAPPFGSLVRVDDRERGLRIYGLVAETRTGSIDPGARPVMRGREGMLDAEIYRQHPDLEHVLRTEFTALIVGFRRDGAIHQSLPPWPPRVHWSVYACDPVEVRAFSERLDFLSRLVLEGAAVDELVAACVRLCDEARGGDRSFRLRVGRELAGLLRDEHDRLAWLLRRIERP